ncbi:protein tilB [Culicoides brevitarsis]|uniref:protein tilB n=1 Tax=Culicoides brevitarsis TaxID=469753 RepID=UPI00307C571D
MEKKYENYLILVTEELVRKKSEHNELLISTLEELSLHQENIERIEHLQNWCRDLKILLLQSNLIPKIENLNKLKKLEYLNLAINNIERIEGLEKLESLQKLDLTLNFIGELTSIENLVPLYNLRELHLTGNPCTDFPEYRDYVIATLEQLETLDGTAISRTDRIKAKKDFAEKRKKIIQRQAEYQLKRDEQKIRVAKDLEEAEKEVINIEDEEEKVRRFWNRKSENCPETRIQIAKYAKDKKGTKIEPETDKPKEELKLFASDGRPYSVNRAKLEFNFVDEPDRYELTLYIYKYLDTSLIDVDVQPNYVRASVKGKVFQLSLRDEVNIAASTSQRSMITGHLLITMPKLNFKEVLPVKKAEKTEKRELATVDYKNIVKNADKMKITPEPVNYDDMPELI